MWAVLSPHTLFNGICCRSVVCVAWHQKQRKSTLGLRGLLLLVCLCRSGFFFFFVKLTAIKALHHSAHRVISRPKLMDTSVGLWWESCASISLFLSVILIFPLSLRPLSCPCLFSFKEFQEDKSSIFFVFIFLLTHLPGDMSKMTHIFSLSSPRTPTHQLCCERGKKEGKGGQGRLFH